MSEGVRRSGRPSTGVGGGCNETSSYTCGRLDWKGRCRHVHTYTWDVTVTTSTLTWDLGVGVRRGGHYTITTTRTSDGLDGGGRGVGT